MASEEQPKAEIEPPRSGNQAGMKTEARGKRSRVALILTDGQFWVPVIVLLAGIALLSALK